MKRCNVLYTIDPINSNAAISDAMRLKQEFMTHRVTETGDVANHVKESRTGCD